MIIVYIIFTSLLAASIIFLNKGRISFAAISSFSTIIKSQTLNTYSQSPKQGHVLKINMQHPSQFNHSTTGRGRIEEKRMNWLDTPWKIDMRPQIFIPETPAMTHPFEQDNLETECCHNCGNHVHESDKFCIFCGSRLSH